MKTCCNWFELNWTFFAFIVKLFFFFFSFIHLSENQAKKSVTDPDMKPIKPQGHVRFRKAYASKLHGVKPPLPQTLAASGAVVHTRLFTHNENVYSDSLHDSHSHSDTSPHILAHISLSILDLGNPLTYRMGCVLQANPISSGCRRLWSRHVPNASEVISHALVFFLQ